MLAQCGGELVPLHLMESPKLNHHLTTYVGPANPEVEKVSYSPDTVWLDKVQTRGFRGVPEAVWNFHIGDYQVCEKWLKDRQAKGGKNPRPGRRPPHTAPRAAPGSRVHGAQPRGGGYARAGWRR